MRLNNGTSAEGCHLVCMWSLKKPRDLSQNKGSAKMCPCCLYISILHNGSGGTVNKEKPGCTWGRSNRSPTLENLCCTPQSILPERLALVTYLVLAASKTSRKLVNQSGCSHCCFSDYSSTNICCPLEEKGRTCISLKFKLLFDFFFTHKGQRGKPETRISWIHCWSWIWSSPLQLLTGV